jgi:hypothetical protein
MRQGIIDGLIAYSEGNLDERKCRFMSEDTKKRENDATGQEPEEKKKVAIDWAETASQELSDYIEEQGIQIRY